MSLQKVRVNYEYDKGINYLWFQKSNGLWSAIFGYTTDGFEEVFGSNNSVINSFYSYNGNCFDTFGVVNDYNNVMNVTILGDSIEFEKVSGEVSGLIPLKADQTAKITVNNMDGYGTKQSHEQTFTETVTESESYTIGTTADISFEHTVSVSVGGNIQFTSVGVERSVTFGIYMEASFKAKQSHITERQISKKFSVMAEPG